MKTLKLTMAIAIILISVNYAMASRSERDGEQEVIQQSKEIDCCECICGVNPVGRTDPKGPYVDYPTCNAHEGDPCINDNFTQPSSYHSCSKSAQQSENGICADAGKDGTI